MVTDSFVVSIETDNAAFADDPVPELACILRRIAERLESGLMQGEVRDSNGNRVGHYEAS